MKTRLFWVTVAVVPLAVCCCYLQWENLSQKEIDDMNDFREKIERPVIKDVNDITAPAEQ